MTKDEYDRKLYSIEPGSMEWQRLSDEDKRRKQFLKPSDEYLLSLQLGSSEYAALSREDQHRRYLLIMAKLDQERAENIEFTNTIIKACMVGAALVILMVILAIPLSFYLGSR